MDELACPRSQESGTVANSQLLHQRYRADVFLVLFIEVIQVDFVNIHPFWTHLPVFVAAIPVIVRISCREDQHAGTIVNLHRIVVGIHTLAFRRKCFVYTITIRSESVGYPYRRTVNRRRCGIRKHLQPQTY